MNNSFDVEQHSGCCAKVNKSNSHERITDQHIHMRKKLYEDLCMCACHTLVVLMDAGEMQTKSMLYILLTCFFYTALKPMAALWLANANLGKAGLP